jgi:hypothetical protein
MTPTLEPEPLVGRARELARLAAAVHARTPLLVHGPAGAGKTFLVQHLMLSLPAGERRACVYVPGVPTIHSLLQDVVRQLHGADRWKGSAAARRPAAGESERDLSDLTSGQMRVMLRGSIRRRRLCLFLDHCPRFSPALARLVNDLIWRDETSVCLLARGRTRDDIGYAWSIYYAPEFRLEVGPLHERDAAALLDSCIPRFGLRSLDSPEFRQGVLRLSRGLPGAIVRMCALAADPRYHFGRQVKLHLLLVDYLLQTAGGPLAFQAHAR